MEIVKDKQRWLVDGKSIGSLYELYCVWLRSPDIREKYPKARPSTVTADMVREYLDDKQNKRGIFRRKRTPKGFKAIRVVI